MVSSPLTRSEIQWTGTNLAEVQRFLGRRFAGAGVMLQFVAANSDGEPETVTVPLHGWVGRADSMIYVRPTSDHDDSSVDELPTLESIVDNLAYEGGYD
jgi:hypothetical protein